MEALIKDLLATDDIKDVQFSSLSLSFLNSKIEKNNSYTV